MTVRIKIEGMNELTAKSNNMIAQIESGKRRFINFLTHSIQIDAVVIRYINRMIYDTPEPEWYERTQNLKRAVMSEETENGVRVYMNKGYLQAVSNRYPTKATGLDPQKKGVDYSWYVHEGTQFNNIYQKDVVMEGRPFMQQTWEEILPRIDPLIILQPLLRMWRT